MKRGVDYTRWRGCCKVTAGTAILNECFYQFLGSNLSAVHILIKSTFSKCYGAWLDLFKGIKLKKYLGFESKLPADDIICGYFTVKCLQMMSFLRS
jgi:hypothetical protein